MNTIETDAADLVGLEADDTPDRFRAGRVRREFLERAVIATSTVPMPGGVDADELYRLAWDVAERLYEEGRKRGLLP